MYERSATVLERYIDKLFGFDKDANLKEIYQKYKNIVEEMKEYREILIEEDSIINQFDEVAKTIEEIQSKQTKLYEANLKLEEERNRLFGDLSENPAKLEAKMEKVEKTLDGNNQELTKLRQEFVKAVEIFTEHQKERNKVTRKRRVAEANHISNIEAVKKSFEEIDKEYVKKIKEFADSDKEEMKKEINSLMIKNGKNEKLGFNKDVIAKAVDVRMAIAEKEAECYISIFERTKRLLQEVESEDIKLSKYEKALRDVSVKLSFLEAEKEYIVAFLDNERMTAISGPKAHQKMMEEACEGFEADIAQINNLYELIIREITNKATKKAYKELYNKTYLKEIEEKEKNFEQEVNHIKIRMGTLINSNYWRIDGIKSIYTTFQEEVSAKFEKDLSEFKLDEIEEPEQENISEDSDIEDEEFGKLPKAIRNMRNRKKIFSDEPDEEFEDISYEDDYDEDNNLEDELDDEDDENEEDNYDDFADEDLDEDDFNEEDDDFDDSENFDEDFEDEDENEEEDDEEESDFLDSEDFDDDDFDDDFKDAFDDEDGGSDFNDGDDYNDDEEEEEDDDFDSEYVEDDDFIKDLDDDFDEDFEESPKKVETKKTKKIKENAKKQKKTENNKKEKKNSRIENKLDDSKGILNKLFKK